MEAVLLTALGVGGATVFGAVLGFAFKKLSHKFSDIVLSFAAGVMLAAAVLGLILPSIEYGNNVLITVVGIFAGALCLNLTDKLVPHLHRLVGDDSEKHHNADLSKVLLFVMAIATSIDALAVGISLSMSLQDPGDIYLAVLLIGAITFLFSAIGVKVGNIFGSRFEKKAQFAGGVILILLGLKILLEHLGVIPQ